MNAPPSIKIAILALLSLMSGCAFEIQLGGPVRTRPATLEGVFQAVNAVDFAQTVTIARRPDCYYEADPVTRNLVGRHPSTAGVYAAWAVESSAHAAVSGWLLRQEDVSGDDAWGYAYKAWQIFSVAKSVHYVVKNNEMGLRPYGMAGWAKDACAKWVASQKAKQ